MKLGYFSPMPPAATGVADYSAALVPYLRAHLQNQGEVAVNAPGDVNLYHLGNNSLHREIYTRALAEPGIVVVHDAVLQHFFLGSLDEAAYVDEFVHNYGEWSRDLGRELWRERARSGADARYFAYPMLKRVASSARAVIVHNPAAATIVRQHAPEARVTEIPHLFIAPRLPDAVETLRFRQSLGIAPGTLLVSTFGHQRETKRLAVLLRAVECALGRGADVRLLVSGEFVSDIFARSMGPLLEHPWILRTGYLPEPDFWKYAAATDLCVNLRYPSAAESSGIAIRLMGIGKAVAFSDDPAIARFPDDACLRVTAGPEEHEMLTGYLCMLAQHRDAARMLGRNAEAHIIEHHNPKRVAAAYWDVLNKS